MAHFEVTRRYNKLDTPGTWTLDGQPFCVGLELPRTPLVAGGLHCIDPGEYRLVMAYSPRFSRQRGQVTYMPRVLDLLGETTYFHGRDFDLCGILAHGGNLVNSIPFGQAGGPRSATYDASDELRSDSDGCLLVGTGFTAPSRGKTGLYSSRAALDKLMAVLRQADAHKTLVTLTIQ